MTDEVIEEVIAWIVDQDKKSLPRFCHRGRSGDLMWEGGAPGSEPEVVHQKLQGLHYFHRRFGCYRAEQTGFRVGLLTTPTAIQRIFAAHEKCL